MRLGCAGLPAVQAFSSCGGQGRLSSRGTRAPPAVEHRLQGARAPPAVGHGIQGARASAAVAHALGCSVVYRILPDQGLNLCPLIGRQSISH